MKYACSPLTSNLIVAVLGTLHDAVAPVRHVIAISGQTAQQSKRLVTRLSIVWIQKYFYKKIVFY